MCCQNSKPPGAGGAATAGCKFFQWSDEAPAAAAETRDITISCTTQRVEDALITKAEHDGTLALLRAVDWGQVRNTSRKNVIPAGDDFCHSFTLGPNMFQPPQPSASSLRYPILERCLRSLVAACDPTFRFTNITVNHNLVCKPHRDTGNIGDSLIIGFGDYTGGQLAIDDAAGGYRAVDIRNRFVRFNGAENKHWTLPFTGERYSAVFYTHRNAS